MRLYCFCCGKSVSNELPEDTTVRAALACPECLEVKAATFTKIVIFSDLGLEKSMNELKI